MTLFKRVWDCIRNLFKKPKPPEPPMPWMPDPTLTIDNRIVGSNSVVFLGDSLTHIAVWQDLFPLVSTANQGMGGNTTAMVLARLQPIIDAKPKKIFLLVGANDLNMGVPHSLITEGHRQIIDRIVKGSPDTELYVQSIFPFGEKVRYYWPNNVPKTWKKDRIALNKAIILICQIYKNYKVQYLAVDEIMTDENGHLKKEFTADQIHLEKPGYDAWAGSIRHKVK